MTFFDFFLGNLTNLVHLDIETNHIKKLPKSVKNLNKLTYTPLELQIKKKKGGDLPGMWPVTKNLCYH